MVFCLDFLAFGSFLGLVARYAKYQILGSLIPNSVLKKKAEISLVAA